MHEIDTIKTKASALSLRPNNGEKEVKKTGRWTKDEHFRFLEALKLFGKEWKRVQQHVGTRSSTQARSHAQKFFVKLEKKGKTLDQFLETLDLKNLEQSMIDNDMEYGSEDDERVPNSVKAFGLYR